MSDLELAVKLNNGYRPLSFKRYDDGHMVIITHQGKKISISKEIVNKTLAASRPKPPAKKPAPPAAAKPAPKTKKPAPKK